MKSLVFLILCLAIGCSSGAPVKKNVKYSPPEDMDYICEGKKAKKKFVFTVSSLFRPPKGVHVKEATVIAQQYEKNLVFIQDTFIEHILSKGYELREEDAKVFHIKGLPKDLNYGDESFRFIRTGEFDFAYIPHDIPDATVEPVNKNQFSRSEYNGDDRSGYPATCDQIYVKGLDPVLESYSLWKDFLNTSPGRAKGRPCSEGYNYDPDEFILDTNFWRGSFFRNRYFKVPEREQAQLCTSAGLNENCHKAPSKDEISSACDSRRGFKESFLSNQWHGNCVKSTEQIEKDPHELLMWEDAVNKDIFLKTSTKVSKSLKGDWKVIRFEWDPSQFCKYARSTDDFYTK